jgi:DEAD/DEAH box helicase domain-containing protein
MFDLHQPRGFRTSYDPKDYNDENDASSNAGLPTLSVVGLPDRRAEVDAVTLAVYEQARVAQINDNRGELYAVRKLGDGSITVTDESLLPVKTWKVPPGGDLGRVAIGEIRTTDALVVGLDRSSAPSGVVISSRQHLPAGLPAFWSFAQVIRRACQVALDIDPQELVMGLQACMVDGLPSARVFLADALDNGAGYAVELGHPSRFTRILHDARGELTRAWENPGHAADCTGSCPDCLRSYDNRRLHGALDWRLALDMLDLAAGGILKTDRWLSGSSLAARAFARAAGGGVTAEVIEELPVLLSERDRKAVILGHPLWRREDEHLTPQQVKVLDIVKVRVGPKNVRFSDLYEVDRQPLAVLRHLM